MAEVLRQRRGPSLRQLVHCDFLIAEGELAACRRLTNHHSRHPNSGGALKRCINAVAGHADEHAGRGLGEQRGERVLMHGFQVEVCAQAGGEQQLEDRLGQATLGQVVGCGNTFNAAEEFRQAGLISKVNLRRQACQALAGDVLPDRAAELLKGLAQKNQHVLFRTGWQGVRDGVFHVLDHAEHANYWGGQNRGVARLVVEGHVAAGDRYGEFTCAVGKTMHCLSELPHHVRVLRGAEVQAVGHGNRGCAGDSNVAVRLRQRQACAHVRIQVGVAAGSVSGDSHAAAGLLVDTQHTSVGVLGLHGVAAHVAVILLRDEVTRAQRRRCNHLLPSAHQVIGLGYLGLSLDTIQPLGACVRTLIDRARINRRRRRVHHQLTLVVDSQAVGLIRHLTDDGCANLPLRTDLHEAVHVLRRHNSTHALLGLGGEDLCCGHVLCAQRDCVQVHAHAAVTGSRKLGGSARQAAATQVLDAHDNASLVELQAALNEHLLCKRVAHLDGRQLALLAFLKGGGAQHGHATNAVKAGAGAEQDHLVASAGSECQVEVLHLQRAHAQCVDQRVAGVCRVKHGLATNIGQAQAIAIAADAVHHARQHTLRVICVNRAEAQLIHHGNRACTHRHDVAHNATDAGCGTLIRLHKGGVVVAFHTEGHRVTATDVHHTSVFTNAGKDLGGHLLRHGLAEVA